MKGQTHLSAFSILECHIDDTFTYNKEGIVEMNQQGEECIFLQKSKVRKQLCKWVFREIMQPGMELVSKGRNEMSDDPISWLNNIQW